MIRYVIKLESDDMSHGSLLTFAQNVASMMDGNLNYTTPHPTLADLGSLITDYSDALTAWGIFPTNRGSTVQYAAVLTTREALEVGLISLANYCENTTPFNKDAFLSGGWQVRRLGEPVGFVGSVRDFRQVYHQLVPSGAVKLRWKRPDGAPKGSISVYRVMNGSVPDINSATQIALVSKTSYIDLQAGLRASNFYWIIPVCVAGYGGIADAVFGYPQGPVIV